MTKTFGAYLKEWRSIRRMSQLDLALAADLSARHLSFLESGRSSPSRLMALRLVEALDVPKAVANQALGVAGFAPAFPAAGPDAPDLYWARRAVERLLMQHAPFPGMAIDRHWNIVSGNAGVARLFAAIVDRASAAPPNMIEVLLALGEGRALQNWEEIAALTLSRLRAEITHLGGDDVLESLALRLVEHPRLQERRYPPKDRMVIPMRVSAAGAEIALFTTIAQFGSAQEIALSELKIELMFPADDATEKWFAS